MSSGPYYPFAGNQFFCKAEPLSIPEAIRRAERLKESVLSRWRNFHAIILRHEEVIQKRWEKKTRQKRERILLEVWPDIPKVHRPDLQALHEVGFYRVPHNYERIRNSLYWPHLNLEDLCELEPLLLLMHSRGRNKPYAFALLDMDPMFLVTVLAPAFYQTTTEQTHGMNLIGVSSDENYGAVAQLANFSNSTPVTPKVHLEYGIKVLEIQDWILHFLTQSCYAILHDIESTTLATDMFAIQNSKICSTQETPVTLHVDAMQQLPYRVPNHINLDDIQGAFLAKIGSARDHIWALREDPAYFEIVIRHHKDLLWSDPSLDLQRLPEELRDKLRVDPAFVPHRMITHAYRALNVWADLYQTVTELKSQPDLFSEVMYTYKAEPVGAQALVSYFALCLTVYGHTLAADMLETGAVDRVTGLSKAHRKPTSNPYEVKPGDIIRQGVAYCYHYYTQGWRDMQLMFEALKRVQESSTLPNCVQGLFSTSLDDLALVMETLHQVHLCDAWARAVRRDFPAQKQHNPCRELDESIRNCNLAGLWDPSDGKFRYGGGKPRSEKVVTSTRSAERNLDKFWGVVDKHYLDTLGETLHDSMRDDIGPERELERTKEWEPIIKDGKVSQMRAYDRVLPSQPHEVPNITEATLDVESQRRAKVKTKGVPNPSKTLQQNEEDVEPEEEDAPRKSKHSVSKRGLRVFSTLFHDVADEERPRETPWSSFVHAMVSIGFAAEKRYGSVWCFKPTDDAAQRNIEIHEPHDGKITYSIGRRIGRRLNRTYGWDGGTFVRANKNGMNMEDPT